MGRFSIGARVRDRDGDLAEVIGKPRKGWREVRYSGDKLDGLTCEWQKSDLEVVDPADIAPFTLEAGKFYRTRDGRKVGPMVNHGWLDGYPWIDENLADGYYSDAGISQRHDPDEDIVAEWVESAIVVDDATDPALVVVAGKRYRGKSGAEYDVVDNSDNEFWPLKTADGERFWKVDGSAWSGRGILTQCPAGDDLVSLVEPQPKFKVGDRVGDFNPDGQATIRIVDGDKFRVQWDGGSEVGDYWWKLSQWEYHTPVEPLAVGAEVVLTLPATIRMIHGDRASLLMPSGGAFTLPIASLRLAA